MTYREMVEMWEAIFAIGKAVAYLLAMASMIKYLVS